jgi:hypothetical protein
MTFDWQSLTALGLVAAAAVYLARVSYSALTKPRKTGCSGCGTCASDKSAPPPVVSIDALADSASERK